MSVTIAPFITNYALRQRGTALVAVIKLRRRGHPRGTLSAQRLRPRVGQAVTRETRQRRPNAETVMMSTQGED